MAISLYRGDLPADVSFGSIVAIDTETSALDSMRADLVGVSLSTGAGEACMTTNDDG